MPPGAMRLHLKKSIYWACKSIYGRSRVFHGVAGKYVSHHHRHSSWTRIEQRQVYGDMGMTEMDWATGVKEMDAATGSIYSGDPGVDRFRIILSYNESHTLSVPFFDITRSFWDFVDPHGRVASCRLTLFLHSSSKTRFVSWIPIGMPREVQGSVDDGLLAPPFHHNGKLLADVKFWVCGSFG